MNIQEFRTLKEAYMEVVSNQLDEISLKTKIKAYAATRDYDADYAYGHKVYDQGDRIKKAIIDKHGEKAGEHAERAGDVRRFGRGTPRAQPRIENNRTYRTTKKGKMHRQDQATLKRDLQDKRSSRNEEYDIYDIILSHLLDEGYAETPEAAEVIMVNMSEEWRESIVEEMLDEGAAADLAARAQKLALQRTGQTPQRKAMYKKLASNAEARSRGENPGDRSNRQGRTTDPEYRKKVSSRPIFPHEHRLGRKGLTQSRRDEKRDVTASVERDSYNYEPGTVTKNPKKLRKQQALGEIGEATAMAKRGLDEPAIRTQIAKNTGGGQAADRATALANRPTYGNNNAARQRQILAAKQRLDFRNTTSSSPGLHGYAHQSNDPEVNAKQAARGAQRSALTPIEKKQLGR